MNAESRPELSSAAIAHAFGTPKPTLTHSYVPGLLYLRTFPALMGYSSRILAESWESNLLYYAAVADELFDHWHAFRRGEIDRARLQERLRPPQARLCRLLRRARDSSHGKGAGLAGSGGVASWRGDRASFQSGRWRAAW